MARKILLADDSVTAQNMGRKILADAGYEVIAVNNGSAALKKIAELKPDLVILDVYMPGYSGLEVCQRLKDSQETARIPVLLTVGKLEPFKPEEAQRVRAEGYIVKPFEASELLSALSKLEDRIVPRAEPSKPGRFARAIAASDVSDRGRSGENGWKSRISFPHEKAEPAEKAADDSPIYNSMNRDLRTVVETPDERDAERAAKVGASRQQDASAEASVDLAAFAPPGIPKDVTPEEVAAIAAAAAQIQKVGALRDEQSRPEFQIVGTNPAGTETAEIDITNTGSQSSAFNAVRSSGSTPVDVPAENRVEELVCQSGANDAEGSRIDTAPPSQDEPVTMAAAGESVVTASPVSRWTAVPVALEADEASLSLDQEMQKAYAAIPAPEPEPVAEPEPATSAEAMPAEVAPSTHPEAPTASFESTLPIPAAEIASAEATTEVSPKPEVADPTRAEFMSPVSEAEVAGLAGLVGLGAEIQQPARRDEAAIVDAEPAPDSETVKTSAAAWANWRESHTSKGNGGAQVHESEAHEPAPAEAARAVAAGAEQAPQDVPAAPPDENPADVASIVDSVLADLRPKLMAEISRKMAEKK